MIATKNPNPKVGRNW